MKHNRKGFTLVEILVVLAIIGVLAAVLLPVLARAREGGKQANCAANLKQIGMAVKMYYSDNKAYPGSFAFLLPRTVEISDFVQPTPAPTPNKDGGDYLKTSEKYLVCPDDDILSATARSSYGDVSTGLFNGASWYGTSYKEDMGRYVWNYYGYTETGITINPFDTAQVTAYNDVFKADPRFFYDPSKPYDAATNYVNPSSLPRLSNRYAPPYTIITHCVYHRIPTANNLSNPNDLYEGSDFTVDDRKNAQDLILRLDGTVDTLDVSTFNTNKTWVKQIK